ncbi:Asp-tRNA(Asn)/Glu-tRNA(Gln) amidotransferase A subunit family amidase [Bradyrhizobium sp. LM3.2]
MPELDFRAAFEAQTTCYISNFAVVISNMLAARGLEKPPVDLIEPMNIRIWEAGRNTSFAERAKMQGVFNTTSRAFGAFFEQWDVILTPITALPTPKVGTREYLTISDNPDVLDWFGNLWRFFAFTPLANLCGMPAISMPMATQEHGLPLGIQAIAKQANDGLLLPPAATRRPDRARARRQVERRQKAEGACGLKEGYLHPTIDMLAAILRDARLWRAPQDEAILAA